MIRLRPRADRRIRAGHPWVFSNEIADDVAALPVGGTVDVVDAAGRFLGRGYCNPRSLIAVRLLARDAVDIDTPAFWTARIAAAAAHRARIYPGRESLRVVNAESDGLPGLIVDRYGPVLAVQLTAAGTDLRRDAIAEALRQALAPTGAVLRNEGRHRALEGLPDERAAWFGEVPERVEIDELGARMIVEPLGAQKTGHFFDQAENRRFAATLCAGRTVLDLYSYTGGFAVHALVAGAAMALAVDRSEAALARAVENARLNGASLETRVGDVADVLRALGDRTFDVVSVDPPAFAKSRKTAGNALRGYADVNAAALRRVTPGGLLFTSSCSHHVEEARFEQVIADVAADAGRRLRLIRRGEQAPDHPVVPGIPETRYLKHLAFRVDG
jgi:23S rRNA (cytosine1962-C5)-methyltransferase